MEQLKIKGISKSSDGEPALTDISIALSKRELVSLLGISGGGKATLFSVIAGSLRSDTRHVLLDGKDVAGYLGRASYMLQEDPLLPYRTIEDNATPPLIVKGMKKRKAREATFPYFRQFGLEDTQKKYPVQLSGDIHQRMALLRTCLFSGSVALLDGPFSTLDMLIKKSVHDWRLKMMGEIHLSTLLITHDIDEAILLSDRVYLLTGRPGRITEELTVRETKPGGRGLGLMKEFLEYKEYILRHLETTA